MSRRFEADTCIKMPALPSLLALRSHSSGTSNQQLTDSKRRKEVRFVIFDVHLAPSSLSVSRIRDEGERQLNRHVSDYRRVMHDVLAVMREGLPLLILRRRLLHMVDHQNIDHAFLRLQL
jgi:hypothetical protein